MLAAPAEVRRKRLAGVRVMVTGASGFVGRWLTLALCKKGADVAVVTRHGEALPLSLDARVAHRQRVDLLERGALTDAVRSWRPSVLFNLAAHGVAKHELDPRAMKAVNADLLQEAAEAMVESRSGWAGLALVHAGSFFECGRVAGIVDEDTAPKPDSDYGKTKLEGTALVCDAVKTARLPAVTARLFSVFGPGERPGRLFPTLLAAARTAGRISLSGGTHFLDWTYVEDVAEGLVRLALLPPAPVLARQWPFDAGALNLATGSGASVEEFARIVAAQLGIDASRLGFGNRQTTGGVGIVADIHRLRGALGWTPSADLPGAIHRAIRRAQSL